MLHDIGKRTKGHGRSENVSEYWAVNGQETLGPSVPSVVIDHESQWPVSDHMTISKSYLSCSPCTEVLYLIDSR